MSFFQFHVPTKILSDIGISKDFAHELNLMGVNRVFVVTDQTLVKLGLCRPVMDALEKSGIKICGVFTDVASDSSVNTVTQCAAQAKSAGAQAFLAIGGGSVMDTAKGANILFTLGGDLKNDYSGAQTITQDLSPLIAIPTTAGTGSEVTSAIVIYDEDSGTKLSFVDDHIMPTLAVLDAELTVGLPPLLTAATGLDALTHAIESVLSVQRSPVSDALAFQAIQLIWQNLLTCVEDGSNLDARSALLTASNLAGMAFNHAMVGVVHSVAHAVGAVARVHHGTANGIFLPYGLEYNRREAAAEIVRLSSSLGVKPSDDQQETVDQVIAAVRGLLNELNRICGFPLSYREAGVKKDQLEKIAGLAEQDGASFYNQRAVGKAEILPYLERAWQGS